MDRLNYVTRQLARAQKKRFENYVVTRIWHLLNDLEIKFVTQQYVVRPTGRALTDMYFPQFGIHIEVNEAYHLSQQEQDRLRKADIVNATNHKILDIDTSNGIKDLNKRIDEIVSILKEKSKHDSFKPWDIEKEQNPQTHIDKGCINVNDDVAFKYSYLAANCFGHTYKGYQKGGTKHPIEKNTKIWFPKLYRNDGWNNQISDDENTIVEISEKSDVIKSHIDSVIEENLNKRIVFARVKSPLGDVMYRFKGKYELDKKATSYQNGLIWKRVSSEVKTYSPEEIIE